MSEQFRGENVVKKTYFLSTTSGYHEYFHVDFCFGACFANIHPSAY